MKKSTVGMSKCGGKKSKYEDKKMAEQVSH
jgi:hypothetical protein